MILDGEASEFDTFTLSFIAYRVNLAEEAALTDLKQKITTHSNELNNEFRIADQDGTGNCLHQALKYSLHTWI